MSKRLCALILLFSGFSLFSQDYFPKNDGVKTKNTNYTAFTNAKIYVTPTQVVEKGTLLIQNGRVVRTGNSVAIPENSVIIDLQGKFIYPSFIDIYSDFGVKKPEKSKATGRSPQYGPTREGFYWNDHVMPENDAVNKFQFDEEKAEALRKAGFGVVNSHIQDGIVRGTGVLVTLNSTQDDSFRILDDRSCQYLSFERSVAKRQSYPTSLMGTMALLRQMYHDAAWYKKGQVQTKDRSLEALIANEGLPQIFEGGGNGNVSRADGIGDQFGIQYAIVGGGDEYERIQEIKATKAGLILPLHFPDAYDVSSTYASDYISLADMRHWNQAPTNPRMLEENGIPFAFTLHHLKSPESLKEKVRKALDHGLTRTKALEALTTEPARILGKSNTIGSLLNGREANFLITSGTIFDKGTILYENWVQGSRNAIHPIDWKDIRGTYELSFSGNDYQFSIKGEPTQLKTVVQKDTITIKSQLDYKNDWLELLLFTEEGEKVVRLSGIVGPSEENLEGKATLPNGDTVPFKAVKTGPFTSADTDKKTETSPVTMPITFPNVGYGYQEKPEPEDLLFKNATVWTSADSGILENTDVLVKDGKIDQIGTNISAGRVRVIDATGKHLTPGIIDEHSHIAALAINEAGQNSSAEVRMIDVVDAQDMDIYRNLAGGVTSLQLLHGSANPIGGQSAILKLKWGEDAAGLIYDNMPKFIKFALGENVKQSNWPSYERFPQTRMGVEQVFINYFQRAREYGMVKGSGEPYRYDEELETLLEILNGERYVSCHSYVQSEINMMMKVAEKFGFTLNTFTHILEGYKVADKMAEHGAGGSTFSDWWAYKYEVKDAIPYNAAIMHSQGVTVAINSDDAEMSRRLNQEAGKMVKYGGVPEEDALKMITINPAKLLHINDRVGSIEEGKDADLVLWSDHPLSVYAKAEKTLIEGATYFDLEKDKQQRAIVQKERNELITMMLKEKENGGKTQAPKQSKKERFHCESD